MVALNTEFAPPKKHPETDNSGSILMYYYGFRYYDPVTGRWPSRDPLSDEAFFSEYAGKHVRNQEEYLKLRAESMRPSYLFAGNDPIGHYDDKGLTSTPSATWKKCYKKFRQDSNFGPKKACDKTNETLGDSQPCSSLGCQPEPSLYAGPRPSRIEADANFLRHTGDGDLDGITLGADKLAHCYVFCVATSYYYFPLATYHAMRRWAGMEDSDPEDTEANEAGFRLGRRNALFWRPMVRNCLEDCADATYDMNFN